MTRRPQKVSPRRKRAVGEPPDPLGNAKAQAAAQLQSIRRLMLDIRKRGRAGEEARDRIMEDPLSIEVRSDWYPPGSRNSSTPGDGPVKYRILLCWGGPSVRIVGDLDEWCRPESARLQCQDWFQPWTDVPDQSPEDQAVLLEYAGHFYFAG